MSAGRPQMHRPRQGYHGVCRPAAWAQVRLLTEMLNLDPWRYFPLQLHVTSSEHLALLAGCAPLPSHMSRSVAPLEVCSTALPSATACNLLRAPGPAGLECCSLDVQGQLTCYSTVLPSLMRSADDPLLHALLGSRLSALR